MNSSLLSKPFFWGYSWDKHMLCSALSSERITAHWYKKSPSLPGNAAFTVSNVWAAGTVRTSLRYVRSEVSLRVLLNSEAAFNPEYAITWWCDFLKMKYLLVLLDLFIHQQVFCSDLTVRMRAIKTKIFLYFCMWRQCSHAEFPVMGVYALTTVPVVFFKHWIPLAVRKKMEGGSHLLHTCH